MKYRLLKPMLGLPAGFEIDVQKHYQNNFVYGLNCENNPEFFEPVKEEVNVKVIQSNIDSGKNARREQCDVKFRFYYPGGKVELSLEEIPSKAYYLDYLRVQYTGLKDKNGEEIYEGDIIQDQHGCRGRVIWNEDLLGFDIEDNGEEIIINGDTLEVIGNVHENPELFNYDK